MRLRWLPPLLLLLMPFAAVGQALGDADTHALAQQLLNQPPYQVSEVSQGVGVPLWRDGHGYLLALKADARATGAGGGLPLAFSVVDAPTLAVSGLQYNFTPRLQVHAQASQSTWASPTVNPTLYGSDLGASYIGNRYSLGLSVESNDAVHTPALPRVLPGAQPGVDGLSDFSGSTHLNAQGRLSLGGHSGLDLGASVGRIRLLPGNLLGVSELDQQALSFGVDHGPLSGSIIGRTMHPAIPGALRGERHWNSVDVGVTVRLPWQGELSIGAQNVWSSGTPSSTAVGVEPDQSPTPYVQYHQDL